MADFPAMGTRSSSSRGPTSKQGLLLACEAGHEAGLTRIYFQQMFEYEYLTLILHRCFLTVHLTPLDRSTISS